ncbi:DUF1109 domain-containing protein [Roseateles terrae]|uniref:Anti-sigma F factor n=1 Tax=Roseateles terrae TaxID=431060 RepID=A0ABR6GWK0_9BURK|nr:DUF1109 domain-containing protein [Roseateles terrae]MBB3196487.1 hypothetical protein [Roseateles terrae]OWQ82985.1 anti-sigma F factor [Roseateles terrae]
MKTDDLVAMLAAEAGAADRSAPPRRYAAAMLISLLGATALMLVLLGLRADLAAVAITPRFWLKVAFPALLAIGAGQMMLRLARPGLPLGRGWLFIVAPLAALWLGAIGTLVLSPVDQWQALLLGLSWRSCPFNIAVLSAPGFLALFWAVRGMAPTRLRLTGAVIGLLAGASATTVYCLHCPEMQLPFWAIWYVAGLLIPTGLGALMGPKWLRW